MQSHVGYHSRPIPTFSCSVTSERLHGGLLKYENDFYNIKDTATLYRGVDQIVS